MTSHEAKALIAELQRKHAQAEEELRKVQEGIDALRMMAEEVFPDKLTEWKGSKPEE